MGNGAERVRMTEDEYLTFERASPERHEYADGEIFVISGGTFEHSNVASNIGVELSLALRSAGKCGVQNADMRVYSPHYGRYVYPDVSVVCGQPEFKDDSRDTLLNPRVIVEVLSPSTEAYDRGDKFAMYQTIPSLTHYVMAAQDKRRIEVYTRQSEGGWLLHVYETGARVVLPGIDVTFDVNAVYDNVWPAAAA